MPSRNLAFSVAFLAACGARSSLDGLSGAAAGAGGNLGTSTNSSTKPVSCAPDGVRLCKDPECPLPPGACPGLGCTPAADRESGKPEDAGVCWNDVTTFQTEPCAGCNDGEVCVHKSPLELVCVPFAVCDALAKLGAGAACRYSDKSPFTDDPILTVPGCPAGHEHVLCGSGCGDCHPPNQGGGFRCVGRSATRPYGICVDDVGIFRCSYAADGSPISTCGAAGLGLLCAVFGLHAPDDVAARRFGVCLFTADCLSDAKGTPLLCLDDKGVNQAN